MKTPTDGTKRYVKRSLQKDWTGKNTMPISTSNQDVDYDKFAKSPLWCPDCGFGKASCRCGKKNKQSNET